MVTFNGFHEETLMFLKDLRNNNDTVWFDENRHRYERYIMEPSKAFVSVMGEKLREISDDIIADPRVNKSLFRINRDVRFSPDKSPYKTNLGIIFWEGPGKRMECPGFYFHLEPDSLMLAGGMYMIPKDLLDRYRKTVSREGPAEELAEILEEIEGYGFESGGLHYKRTPRGYQDQHPFSFLLRHNGVYAMTTTGIPNYLFSEKLVDHTLDRFKKMNPLNRWFLKYMY
jgi:uncharacterized protein (TIGR02453 family)